MADRGYTQEAEEAVPGPAEAVPSINVQELGSAELMLGLASRIGNQRMARIARSGAASAPGPHGPLARSARAAVQRARRLARDPVDEQVPAGVTANAVALPTGANLADPSKSTVVPDSSLPGGWTDGGTTTSSGRVGAIDRILIDGLSGHQRAQPAVKGFDPPSGKFAGAVGSGGKGRAVALVPQALRQGSGGPVAVVIHFHGIRGGSWGMRATGAAPEDVSGFQIPQQLEAFLGSHPGARLIVLCPIGITTADGHNTEFGIDNVDTFVSECLQALGSELPSDSAAGKVYLSAHSGGGLYISRLLANPSRLPQNFGGLFGFESWHGDEGIWETFIAKRMDADLAKLKDLRTNAVAGQTPDQIAQAQIAYLTSDGFRFVGFGGFGGYADRVRDIRAKILAWFARNQAGLTAATGGRADVLNQLWSNYQANFFAGSTHGNALSKDANFGRALGSLGASVPVSQPSGPTLARQQRDPADQGGGVNQAGQAPRPFTLEHYEMSQDEVVVVKAGAGKREIRRRVIDIVNEVLRLAGQDPVAWYNSFTSGVTFLGRRVRDPIHQHLAEHLRTVEHTLAAAHGGPGADPAVAGVALGLTEDIIGARRKPTSATVSMHMFGLAIDVNYTANPFIGSSANDVFGRAGLLINGTAAAFRNNMTSTELTALNGTLVAYFALLDDQAGLQTRLTAATGAPWHGMAPDAGRRQIQADLTFLGTRWERSDPASLAVIKRSGFTNLSSALVTGIGLSWGAAYGDMMHFDMRTDGGVGQAIRGAVDTWMRSQERAARQPAPSAPPQQSMLESVSTDHATELAYGAAGDASSSQEASAQPTRTLATFPRGVPARAAAAAAGPARVSVQRRGLGPPSSDDLDEEQREADQQLDAQIDDAAKRKDWDAVADALNQFTPDKIGSRLRSGAPLKDHRAEIMESALRRFIKSPPPQVLADKVYEVDGRAARTGRIRYVKWAVANTDWAGAALGLNGFSDSDLAANLPRELGALRAIQAAAPTAMPGWSARVTDAIDTLVRAEGEWPLRSRSDRVLYVMNRLVDHHGLPVPGAAGIVGNLMAESGLLPTAVEGSDVSSGTPTPLKAPGFDGTVKTWTPDEVMNRDTHTQTGPRLPGVGLAQWTDTARRTAFFAHGSAFMYDMDGQIQFLIDELTTNAGFAHLNAQLTNPATSVQTAADAFLKQFENPAHPEQSQASRRASANTAAAAYNAAHPAHQ